MAHYATLETSADLVKRKNFFNVVILFSAVWMVFQFVSIYLFGVFLESPALVGVFLGLGSAVAMAVDIPVGVLQKYFRPRSLIIFASALMLVVGAIFTYLIMGAGVAKEAAAAAGGNAVVGAVAGFFFGHAGNVLLIGVAAVLYGLVSEFYDVTSLSYLMNNADPSEYAELISKRNVMTGVGSVIGLALASVILLSKDATSSSATFFFIMIPFLVTISALVAFVVKYFDNGDSTVSAKEIYKLKVVAARGAADAKAFVEDPAGKLKGYAVASVQTADFQKIAAGLKMVLLKPMELRKTVDFNEVAAVSKKEFQGLWDTVLNPKFRNWKILWIAATIILFGYWDTFVVTYLADYISKEYKFALPYLLIGVIAIPVFTLQMPFIKLSQKTGYYAVVASGVALSAAAAFCFLIPGPLTVFLAFGLLNAVGYAAAMPLAQSVFSEYYNELYAKNYGLSEIDSNTSAAPLKVTLNLANVVGSALGGVLIAVNYGFSFFVYGALLAALLAVGVANKKKWGL